MEEIRELNIPNTFVPYAENKVFSLSMILVGLKTNTLKYSMLPEDVKKRVDTYIAKTHPELVNSIKTC